MITTEQYIEHEVQIRVLKETTDSRFTLMQRNFDDKFASFEKRVDDRFNHMDYKINFLIGIVSVAILIPTIKSLMGFFQ